MPYRILIVDDETDMLVLLRLILTERTPHEVITTPNPLEVEQVLNDREIHLVVTDWRMPGRDGMEVVEAVHHQDPDIPVILMTAYGTPESAQEAERRGAFDYLPKPFRRERILSAIEKGLAAYTEKKKIHW